VGQLSNQRQANGLTAQRRQQQAVSWMWERIEAGLRRNFMAQACVQASLSRMQDQVHRGELPASVAARQLLDMASGKGAA
jgi:LAO/AO transport system kinase